MATKTLGPVVLGGEVGFGVPPPVLLDGGHGLVPFLDLHLHRCKGALLSQEITEFFASIGTIFNRL